MHYLVNVTYIILILITEFKTNNLEHKLGLQLTYVSNTNEKNAFSELKAH